MYKIYTAYPYALKSALVAKYLLRAKLNTLLLLTVVLPLCAAGSVPLLSNSRKNSSPVIHTGHSVALIDISGKVTDEKGNALAGVNVNIKGKLTGTTTDAQGRYVLKNLNPDAILIFSLVGMESREIAVNNNILINVTLKEAHIGLNEVVVVGYGTQLRKDVTGAVSSIKEKDIHERPINNLTQALQGKSAGIYVSSSSNEPGASASVFIRGKRSINAQNDPLYVIDGIPVNGGMNDINPDDIVSMEILKDASSTAIYGSRGANGVVIVSTRRGKTGPPQVNYNAYAALSMVNRYVDVMNGPEYAEYKRESRRAAGTYNDADPVAADKQLFEAVELTSISNGSTTDWQDLMIKNGIRQNHELNINGGAEKTKYSLSFGYLDDKGYIPTQRYTRYTTRVNIDQELGTRFKVGLSTLATFSTANTPNSYYNTLISNPLAQAYDAEGTLIFLPTSDALLPNPMADLADGAAINRNKRLRIFSSMYGEVKILEGLTLRTNFGPDLIENRTGTFYGSKTTFRNQAQNTASTAEDLTTMYTWENILNYKKTFRDKHRFDFTGLYSITSRYFENTGASVINLPLESFEYENLGAASQISGVNSGFTKWTILSYMGRANYAFDNRYMATVTARADGSSRFGKNQKWGFFPSAALGWNISNEKFMTGQRYISNLKLRISYGRTGNTAINPYQTQGMLSRTTYDFGGTDAYGYRPSTLRNNNLKWESTTAANIGVDFGFLDNRISGAIEYYQSKTKDLLLDRVLPASGGFEKVLQNVGSTKNRGFEFSISTQNIKPNTEMGFSWSTDLNLSASKEKIVELSQGKIDDIGNSRFIGQPINVFYDYKKLGIWQLGEETEAAKYGSAVGQLKIQDTNNNGKIDANDKVILGKEMPSFTGGMTNRFSYKRFSFSALVVARFGNMIQSSLYSGNTFALQGRYNNLDVNYWTKNNPTNDFPQPSFNRATPVYASALTYFDGSFVKIKNLSLGYSCPAWLTNRIAVHSLSVYASVQDPFTFAPYVSKYKGTDPEIPGRPAMITYTFGINASF